MCLNVYTIQDDGGGPKNSWNSVCLAYKEKYIFVFYVKNILDKFPNLNHIFSLKGKKVVYFIFLCANDMYVISPQRSIRREWWCRYPWVSLWSLFRLLYLPASFKMILKCLLAVSWACMPTYDVIQLFAGWGKKTCK